MRVEDLKVYKKSFELNQKVFNLTLEFPKYETYELGSQLRRSANSIPANIAECFGNKHTKIYLEGISRAMGELRETIHHLKVAYTRKYLNINDLRELIDKYRECSKMLYGLEKSLKKQ